MAKRESHLPLAICCTSSSPHFLENEPLGLLNVRRTAAFVSLSSLLCVCQPAGAHSPRLRARTIHSSAMLHMGSVLMPGILPAMGAEMSLVGQQYRLNLHHLHTGESLSVVYRVGDTYIPSAMAELNHFLRDHRTQEQSHYDPAEFDLLHNVLSRLGKPAAEIDVVCGYRTPWSNNFLRTRSSNTGVAKNSQHMLAKAIDIRVPGVTTSTLRDAALSLQAGGVGYYPISQFVHVDVGPVRQWTFAGGGSD
jgi:uncharacterized protein YcbK (DUF882 family)